MPSSALLLRTPLTSATFLLGCPDHSLRCATSVYLLLPGVASTFAACLLTAVSLCLVAIAFAAPIVAGLPSLLLSSFCLCPLLLLSLPHTGLHQSAPVHMLVLFLLAPPGLLRYFFLVLVQHSCKAVEKNPSGCCWQGSAPQPQCSRALGSGTVVDTVVPVQTGLNLCLGTSGQRERPPQGQEHLNELTQRRTFP